MSYFHNAELASPLYVYITNFLVHSAKSIHLFLAMDSEFAFSFLLLYFVVSLRPVICQTSGTVNVGESLVATGQSPPWFSPSKDFAFGFRQINENDDFFLL